MLRCDSEMETAHRNMALLHYIKSKDVNETVHTTDQLVTVRNSLLQSFPPNTSLDDTMKFYTRVSLTYYLYILVKNSLNVCLLLNVTCSDNPFHHSSYVQLKWIAQREQ